MQTSIGGPTILYGRGLRRVRGVAVKIENVAVKKIFFYNALTKSVAAGKINN